MKRGQPSFPALFAAFLLTTITVPTVSFAQSPCSYITYSVIHLEPCRYRFQVDNSSECYPFIRLLLETADFDDWAANTAEGWIVEQITASELLLTHSGGLVPLGTSNPVEFDLPADIDHQVTVLWDYNCDLGEGCITEISVMACTVPAGGCGQITYSAIHLEPCRYRFQVDNSSECYPFIRLLLDTGEFGEWTANTTAGWIGELVTPSELLLTHNSGFVPLGVGAPVDFDLPADIDHQLTVLWDYNCDLGEGCEMQIPLMACMVPADACISGVKYWDCEGLPYTDQDPLPSCQMTLTNDQGQVLATAFTDETGNYLFCDLPPGQYQVTAAGQPGWTPFLATSGQATITLAASAQVVQDFAFCPDCSCESLYLDAISMAWHSMDTCAYTIVVQNLAADCFESINISLGSGEIAGWMFLEDGWEAELLDEQHLRLLSTTGSIPVGGHYPLKLNVTGSEEVMITMSASEAGGGMTELCERSSIHNCPLPQAEACCPDGMSQGPELITNGDFEAGNTGFTSDYNFTPSPGPGQGNYTVWNYIGNNGFWNALDHTTGSPTGRFLVVDGSHTPGLAAWRHNVTIVPDSNYQFCAYVNNLFFFAYQVSDPEVEVWLVDAANNATLLTSEVLPENPDVWIKMTANWSAPATVANPYQLEIREAAGANMQAGNDFAVDDISFRSCSPPVPCHCGTFTDLFVRSPQGAPSQPLMCGGPPVNIACPAPGQAVSLSGFFQCEGSDCPPQVDVDWQLTGPDGSTVSTGITQSPWFAISLPSSGFSQVGLYTLTLTGYCGSQSCPCVLQFIVDDGCPDPCPCDLAELQANVEQGFASAFMNNSCHTCFAPLALDDCDEVEWLIDDLLSTPVGTSTGNQSFCYTFPVAGTYTVYMRVTRYRADGSLCESFTKAQTVVVTCLTRPVCDDAVLSNPGFSEGGVLGSLGNGGESAGWIRVWGDPHVYERPASRDDWGIRLTGNADTSDVLSREETICLGKTEGTFYLRLAGDPIPGAWPAGSPTRRRRLHVEFHQPGDFVFGECPEMSCFALPPVDLSAVDTGWFDLEIPFDLSEWVVMDPCGGVEVRPVFYLSNDFGENQGGGQNRFAVVIDDVCLEGPVSTDDPLPDYGVRLFPNPANGEISLRFSPSLPKHAELQLVDLWGRSWQSISLRAGQTDQRWSVAGLPAGIYFVRLLEEGHLRWATKLVKS